MSKVRVRALAFGLGAVVTAGACSASAEVVGSREADIHGEVVGGRVRADEPLQPPAQGPARASSAAETAEREPTDDPYRGLGTWIDIYDEEAWAHPVATVRSMKAHGVRTIYLQTSNYSRGRPFVHPEGVATFLDAAHRRGLEVVAWYLPGFRDLRLDLRRIARSIAFRTARGNGFDSFALDIESPEVRRPWVRTRRLLRLSDRLRRIVGRTYPLGAIVASPHRMEVADPRFWPGFPWRRLAETYDAFLPMTYYTYRVHGPRMAAWYTAQNVRIIRQQTSGLKVPIHVVGGISFDATGPETRGFVRTVRKKRAIGASYYTFPGITGKQWQALRALRRHNPNV